MYAVQWVMGTRPYPAQNPPAGQGRVAILATRPNPQAGFCFATGKNCLKWQFRAILGHFATGFFQVGFLVGNLTCPRVAKWAGCQSQNPALPGPLHSLIVTTIFIFSTSTKENFENFLKSNF